VQRVKEAARQSERC